MFEYWFHGVKDPQDPEHSEPFDFHGTTYDFIEIICQIAKFYSSEIAGIFVTELLNGHADELDFLRVIDWKFEFDFVNRAAEIHAQDGYPEGRIVLHKVK